MKPPRQTIQDFHRMFPDNDACLRWLFEERFASFACPKCNRTGMYSLQAGTSHFVCSCGGHQLSPKKLTIFEKSDTDLYKWFYAMFLMANAKNGVSAKEIERQVGVTYKTAWRMARLIRYAMSQTKSVFSGTVEADETYMAGRKKGLRVRGRGTKKTPVVGVVERGGNIAMEALEDARRPAVMGFVDAHVEAGSRLMTDEYAAYAKAGERYVHATVRHGIREYVRGEAHTNTIEGAWSQVKRGISGTHHSVSSKHLQAYLDFYAWQWNRRNAEEAPFSGLLRSVLPRP